MPYLSITGETDFSAAYAEGFAKAAEGRADVVVVTGGDHIFGALGEDQTMTNGVIAQTADWFRARL